MQPVTTTLRAALTCAAAGLLLAALGIESRADDTPAAATPRFDTDVMPIFKRRCVECHGISKKSSGLRLDSFEHAMRGTRKGAVVVPGKSAESALVERLEVEGEDRMPPEEAGDALNAAEISVIKAWIDAGAAAPPAGSGEAEAVEFQPLPAEFAPVVAVAGNRAGTHVAVGRGATVVVSPLGESGVGEPVARLEGHRDVVQSLAFSPDGAVLASGGFRVVILWSTSEWKELRRLEPHADRVLALDFDAEGKTLAAAGGVPSSRGEIAFWNVETGASIARFEELHSDTIFALDFSPDGAHLATASADRVVGLVEVASGKRVAGLDGHTHHVVGVRFSGDGKRIYSAGADGKIKSWDVEKREKIKDFNGHGKAVMAIDSGAEGNVLVSVSGDRTLRFWNPDGNQVASFGEAQGWLYGVAVFGEGRLVATAGRDKVVRIYDVKARKLLHSIGP